MKNASGLTRSPEFIKAHPGQAPKVHHLRVMKHADGVKVTHHASADAKSHADHVFSHGEHDEMMNHITQHMGMSHEPDSGSETEEEEY